MTCTLSCVCSTLRLLCLFDTDKHNMLTYYTDHHDFSAKLLNGNYKHIYIYQYSMNTITCNIIITFYSNVVTYSNILNHMLKVIFGYRMNWLQINVLRVSARLHFLSVQYKNKHRTTAKLHNVF